MKYLVMLCDGMADRPVKELGDQTPMEAAHKPNMDALARSARVGTVLNVPHGMTPESDPANLAVMSYDPAVYSHGRSPLEAMSMGLTMTPDQTAIRCNLLTLSEEEDSYEQRHMIDHSADEISTEEAGQLLEAVNAALATPELHFYTGVSYRHCLLWRNMPDQKDFARPHDIPGRVIGAYLPPEPFLSLMKKSYDILCHHPVNEARRARGLRPANSIWLWSPGKKPELPSFYEKWGLHASVISAVDLIKGIGICAGMEVLSVEGATGNIHTNFTGKADAAMDAFRRGQDFVYIHVEAPDECGHRGEIENKVRSIELIDEKILGPVTQYLAGTGEPYRVLVLPDHPTPLALRTHSSDPVPFLLFDSEHPAEGVETFSEQSAAKTGWYLPQGFHLLEEMLGRKPKTV